MKLLQEQIKRKEKENTKLQKELATANLASTALVSELESAKRKLGLFRSGNRNVLALS